VSPEPNWPPPEWGTPEPDSDLVHDDEGRPFYGPPSIYATEPSEPPEPPEPPRASVAKPRPKWCDEHRVGYRPPSYHERCSRTPRIPALFGAGRDSLTGEKIPPPPPAVVVHQSVLHHINDLEDRVLRLEHQVDRLMGRQTIDDIHDGPWDAEPVQVQ